uniref:Uncharacterized protein n=1 Tax=Haemonchus contortus TaxID=6289 RepID=A0A7I4Y9W5_HAECO
MGKQKDNGKKPSKKKGYDDVQISDLDEDDDKKDKPKKEKKKDVKDGDKKRAQAGATEKKEEPKIPKEEASNNERAQAAAEENSETYTGNTDPEQAKKVQQKIVPIPKYSAPSQSETKKTKCCILM